MGVLQDREPYLPRVFHTSPDEHRSWVSQSGGRMNAGRCMRCGRCCERWGWSLRGSPDDLVRWLNAGRHDILRHVLVTFRNGNWSRGDRVSTGDMKNIASIHLWLDSNGRRVNRCPFLEREGNGRALCRINDFKPDVCREFMPWKALTVEFYGNCMACPDRSP